MQNETCNSPFYHKKLLMDGPSAPKICPVQRRLARADTPLSTDAAALTFSSAINIRTGSRALGFTSVFRPLCRHSHRRRRPGRQKPTRTPGQLHLYRPGREGLIRPFSFSAPAPGAPARRAGPERPPTPSPCPRWQAPQPAEDRCARGQRAKSQCR